MVELSRRLACALGVDRVCINKIDAGLCGGIDDRGARVVGCDLLRRLPTYEMILGETLEATLANLKKKRRYTFRRQLQKVLELAGASIDFFSKPSDSEEFLRLALPIAESTYQSRMAVTIANSAVRREQVRACFASEVALCGVLRIGGRPVAYQIGSVAGDRYRLEDLGYDRSYEHLAPGASLLFASIPEMIGRGLSRLSFGEGRSQYKEVLSNSEGEIVTLAYHSPGFHGSFDKSTGRLAHRLDALTRWLVPSPLISSLKRRVKRSRST